LSLDEVTDHIIGHPRADAAETLTANMHRLVEHQGDRIMEARRARAQALGQRITIGPMQERLTHPARYRSAIKILLPDMSRTGGCQHAALRIDDEQLGNIRQLCPFPLQHIASDVANGFAQVGGEVRQMTPVTGDPVLQDAHP